MRSVQRERFGEERYFLMVPAYEYLARRGEDVGSTALKERKRVRVLKERKEGEEMGLALRRHPVLKASIVRNSSEENVGRS